MTPKNRTKPPSAAPPRWTLALVREHAELRSRVVELERRESEHFDDDPANILLDLSALVGRMFSAARANGRAFHEAARVLEAVRTTFYLSQDASPAAVFGTVAAAADGINFAATGKHRGGIQRWRDDGSEDGPVAERVCDLFAHWLIRPWRADEEALSVELGAALETCAVFETADRILPRTGTAEKRADLYARTIRGVLETNPKSSDEMLAELVIVACAKASGVPRPSRLFAAKRKREKAALERTEDAAACRAPPGVVGTWGDVAESRGQPSSRLPDGPAPAAPAPDVSARPPARCKPLR